MANSFSFNGIDMSAYGVIKNSDNLDDGGQDTEAQQLQDKAYGGNSTHPQENKVLEVSIIAPSAALLRSYMDSVKAVINNPDDCALAVDTITDRYWMVRWGRMSKVRKTDLSWEGTITFTAFDANAYANTETTSPHTIDASPKTFNEVVGGTAITKPVYTLTADGAATSVTIENITSGEKITCAVVLAATDVLVFDCKNGTIKKNGDNALTGVGVTDFTIPGLLPGTNAFSVTGFSGTMVTVYKNRYS